MSRLYDELPLRFIEWTTKRRFGWAIPTIAVLLPVSVIALAFGWMVGASWR